MTHEQESQLSRVSACIAECVIAFFHVRRAGDRFHAADLCEWVWGHDRTIAPASPDRVMRELRRVGAVNYFVVDRRQSLYEVLAPRTAWRCCLQQAGREGENFAAGGLRHGATLR